MRNVLKPIVTCIDTLNGWFAKLVSPLALVMVGIVIYEVAARYLFNSPTTWALEASTMAFGAYIVGSGPISLRDGAQVSMDIFSSKWSPRTKAAVNCATYPLFFAFMGALLWKAWEYGIESWNIKEMSQSVWGQPLYHWKMFIVVGIGLFFLQGIAEFLRNAYLAATGEEL